jgi:hypothetical protein
LEQPPSALDQSSPQELSLQLIQTESQSGNQKPGDASPVPATTLIDHANDTAIQHVHHHIVNGSGAETMGGVLVNKTFDLSTTSSVILLLVDFCVGIGY